MRTTSHALAGHPLLGFAAVNRLASDWSGLDWTESFTTFGLAYAPLGVTYSLGAHVIGGLLEDGGHTLNAFANGLGLSLDLPGGASPAIVSAWDSFFVGGWLWLGVGWSGLIAWQVADAMAGSKKRALAAFVPHVAFMTVCTALVALAH